MHNRTVSRLIFVAFFIVLLGGCTARNPWMKGDQLFKQKQYAEAADAYNQAAEKYTGRSEPHFNRGTAQYMAEQSQDAISTFQDVARRTSGDLQERSEFNTGNAYLGQGDSEKAIEHYKRTLYLNPGDVNAKWNLELAQQQQQQHEQGQEEQKQQEQKPDDDKQDSDEREKPQEQPQEDRPGDADQQPQRDQQELTQKEAERLLKALSQQDRDLQKELRKPPEPVRTIPFDKDW
jgi:Ca-activated chloride channel family protein